MKQASRRLMVAVAGLITLCSWPGFADDMIPPCWRGRLGSTFQMWNFNTGSDPAAPESVTNTNGNPQATITTGPAAGGWANQLFLFGTNQGIWDLGKSGTMALAIPNQSSAPGGWKLVAVQVMQYRDGIYKDMAAVLIPGALRVNGQIMTNSTTPFGGRWVVDQSLWLLDPCPNSETITITAGTNSSAIDHVVVDTLCSSGDVFPPCWRGQSGTTFESWTFHSAANPAAPEQKNNPGSPAASIQVGGLGLGWQNQLTGIGCRQGYWDLGIGGTIAMNTPNFGGSSTSFKYVRVQVTQYQDASTYSTLASVSITGATRMGGRPPETVEPTGFGRWVVDQSVWRVSPSPASETILITSAATGALIDQVVVDTESLDFICPANIVVGADPGQCSKSNVTWTEQTVDGCIVTNVTYSSANGSTFLVGTNVITCTIRDKEGGTNVCSFTVTVRDNEPPVAHCPANITVAKTAGQCGATVSFTATASDNCSGATVTCTPTNGSFFPVGLTTVTCTAHDGAGNNSGPCTFQVRVVDYSGDALPPCWRGWANSTFQQWAFSTGANPVAPELKTNPGNPTATIQVGTLGMGWQDQLTGFGCEQGYWDLGVGGTITLGITNTAGSPTSYNYVRVKVTQYQDAMTYKTLASVSIAGATRMGGMQTNLDTTPFGGQWQMDQSVWRIAPSPAAETIVITGGSSGALIDQVIVDTLSLEDFTCPTDITVSTDPGQCSKSNVTWAVPAVDGCLVTNISCTPTNGSAFQVGTNPVTCVISDGEGGSKICAFTVTVHDTEPPTISNITATQTQPYVGVVNVKNCVSNTVQGTVNISVQASDQCPLNPPAINLTNGTFSGAASYVNESPVGTFNYTWSVTPSTANGTWTATVTAGDDANTTTTSFTLCVDTNLVATAQVTGQVQLGGFLGTATVPLHTRTVTFTATGGASTKTWPLALANVSGETFNYTLTDVPDGTTAISAKTDWHLRRRLAVTLDSHGQGVVNFTGASELLPGDIAPLLARDNRVNTFDVIAFKSFNGRNVSTTPAAAQADINGDGRVNISDYTILKGNLGKLGEAQ